MISATPAASVAATPSPGTPNQASRAQQPQAPEMARSSAGESSAANIKTETAKAVTAPEQTSVAPRLRDQETAERTERTNSGRDEHAGPPPTFEESPLERQARTVFDPPEVGAASETTATSGSEVETATPIPTEAEAIGGQSEAAEAAEPAAGGEVAQDPPPTPTERAEASFQETKVMAESKEPASVDVAS